MPAKFKILGNFGLLLSLAMCGGTKAQAKQTLCTAQINSSDELEVFRKHLPASQFDYVELTDFASDPAGHSADWFDKACAAGVKCDVLVVSGHFGGDFFGSSDYELKMDDLESRSCQNRCPGILSNPAEVYLFGCNTLSDKNKDSRTPEEYLNVLLKDGRDRADAERTVETRYGHWGDSYNDRIERIFEDVPFIYGFKSISPLGARIRPTLDRYLNLLGDYSSHLREVREGNANANAWLSSMNDFNRLVTTGLHRNDVNYSVKTNMCELRDPAQKFSTRLHLAISLLTQAPQLYLTVVSSFVNANISPDFPDGLVTGSADAEATDTYLHALSGHPMSPLGHPPMMGRPGALGGPMGGEALMARVNNAEATPDSMRVDLLRTRHNLGWLSTPDFTLAMRELLLPYVLHPNPVSEPFVWSILNEDSSLKDVFSAKDLQHYSYLTLPQLRIAAALSLPDEQITEHAIKSFKQAEGEFFKDDLTSPALQAIEKLPGAWNSKAALFRDQLDRAVDPVLRRWLENSLVETTTAAEQLTHLKNALADANTDNAAAREDRIWQLAVLVSHAPTKPDTVVLPILQVLWSQPEGWHSHQIPWGLITNSSAVQDWIAQNWSKNSLLTDIPLGVMLMHAGPLTSEKLKNKLVDYVTDDANENTAALPYYTTILAQSSLNPKQMENIRIYAADFEAEETHADDYRNILSKAGIEQKGDRRFVKCRFVWENGASYVCREAYSAK